MCIWDIYKVATARRKMYVPIISRQELHCSLHMELTQLRLKTRQKLKLITKVLFTISSRY